MFSKSFVKALAGEAVLAFASGALGVVVTGDFSKAALIAALTAGARAVIGVLVRNVGTKGTPTL